MKNKFWALIIAVIVVLPTIIACANYIMKKDEPVTKESVTEGYLIIPMNGEESKPYKFEKSRVKLNLNNIDSNLLKFFTDITEKATKASGLPESVANLAHYTVSLTSYNRPVTFKYYFTEDASHCYFTDEGGTCFRIPTNYAKAFLISKYGMGIFSTSKIPTYSAPNTDEILPETVEWTYQTVDDKSYSTISEKNKGANKGKEFMVVQSLENLLFDIAPGSIKVSISQDGESILKDGLMEQLGISSVPKNIPLDISLTAKWFETDERKSEGTLTYKFKCIITDAPIFQITYNSDAGDGVHAGDFFCITALNIVGDGSDISFTSSVDLGAKPKFYKDGNLFRALVPISLKTETGACKLTFACDGTEQSFDITILPNPYASTPLAEDISSDKLTEASESEFESEMKSVLTADSSTKYFNGEFIYPYGSMYNIKGGFGRTFQTKGGYTYTNNWVRLNATSGSEIKAMNDGKVVYTGEQTMTGRTVVVDHGFGLMSIYANLESISVEKGDVVTVGEVLGKSGATGYTNGSMVSFAVTVNGKFVCPYEIMDEQGVILSN